jgi:hypothetical protein
MLNGNNKKIFWNKNAGREHAEPRREFSVKRFGGTGASRAKAREGLKAALAILTVVAMLVAVTVYFTYISNTSAHDPTLASGQTEQG